MRGSNIINAKGSHYHIVCDDGDEEEVHKDEAVVNLLAANGFD